MRTDPRTPVRAMRSRSHSRRNKAALIVALIVLGAFVRVVAWQSAPGAASTVHVRAGLTASGTPLSCADATTRCVPSEHATIDACMDAASAGDVCWVTAGTYTEAVTPAISGASGNPITLLASGAVTLCSMDVA